MAAHQALPVAITHSGLRGRASGRGRWCTGRDKGLGSGRRLIRAADAGGRCDVICRRSILQTFGDKAETALHPGAVERMLHLMGDHGEVREQQKSKQPDLRLECGARSGAHA